MSPMVIEYLPHIPVGQQQLELGEQKGLGHPDTMCDALAAQVILAPGASSTDVETPIREIIHADLATLPSFITQLTCSAFPMW